MNITKMHQNKNQIKNQQVSISEQLYVQIEAIYNIMRVSMPAKLEGKKSSQ